MAAAGAKLSFELAVDSVLDSLEQKLIHESPPKNVEEEDEGGGFWRPVPLLPPPTHLHLRHTTSDPRGEEENHNRGYLDTRRKKLWLKEPDHRRKRLLPRFGGFGSWF